MKERGVGVGGGGKVVEAASAAGLGVMWMAAVNDRIHNEPP